jgi:DNA-directed RNA polymerase specialized sigma24 family protein
MRYRPAELEKQFKVFKDGQMDLLEEILTSERERLFDFLMRMTGQVSKSVDTSIEASNVVGAVADNEESFQDFLIILYKTARNFAIDAWNADTSKLENAAYRVGQPENAKSNEKQTVLLISLEHILRSLSPKQREILLLHERYGFAPDEVAEITGFGMSDVEEVFSQALSIVESAMPGNAGSVPELMTKLRIFPVPEDDGETTQNLSLVFKNLKKSSKGAPSAWLRLMFAILALGLIGFSVWKYELVVALVKKFLSDQNQ